MTRSRSFAVTGGGGGGFTATWSRDNHTARCHHVSSGQGGPPVGNTLFTTQVPASPNANDGTDYTLGTVIIPLVGGQVTHGRWLFPTTLPSGPVAWVLYDRDTQVELARATFVAPTPGAWNATPELVPHVTVLANQELIAAVETPNRFVAEPFFFDVVGLTNGNLSAPVSGADPLGNGRYAESVGTYPTSHFNATSYFADLYFVAG